MQIQGERCRVWSHRKVPTRWMYDGKYAYGANDDHAGMAKAAIMLETSWDFPCFRVLMRRWWSIFLSLLACCPDAFVRSETQGLQFLEKECVRLGVSGVSSSHPLLLERAASQHFPTPLDEIAALGQCWRGSGYVGQERSPPWAKPDSCNRCWAERFLLLRDVGMAAWSRYAQVKQGRVSL